MEAGGESHKNGGKSFQNEAQDTVYNGIFN